MAQVPYSGVPGNEPGLTPPNDYQDIRPTPAAFGGATGAAMEQAGQRTASGMAQLYDAVQGQQNTHAVNEGYQQFLNSTTDLLSKQSDDPDQRGFLYTEGRQAQDGYQPFQKKLNDEYTRIRGGLQNDAQRLEFDRAAKREQYYTLEKAQTHTLEQFKVWGARTNDALTDATIRAASTVHYNDPERLQHDFADVSMGAVRALQSRIGDSGDPALYEQAAEQARSRLISSVVEARAAAGDPGGAMDWLKHGTVPDTNGRLTPVMSHLAPQMQMELESRLRGRADQTWSDQTLSSLPPPGAPADLHGAIYGVESGSGANSATSINGAVGPMQIEPATFQQYAKPGEKMGNPADNKAVGDRIIDDYNAKYGGDPARVAVAYFSGPGNVAPPGSPTPWITDKKDGNGQSVSGYVAKVAARMGDGYEAALQDAVRRAPTPEAANYLMLKAQRQRAEADRFAKEQTENAASDYTKQMWKDPLSVKLDDILNDPRFGNDWRTRDAVINMWSSRLKKTGEDKDSQSFGTGFWPAYKRVNGSGPDRITDPTDLIKMAGPDGGLTIDGVKELTAELQGRRTPEGEDEAKSKAAVLEGFRTMIVKGNDSLGIQDGVGEQKFGQFTMHFLMAYNKGRANKTPEQLLDEKSPDFVGKMAKDFMRTDAEVHSDLGGGASSNTKTGVQPVGKLPFEPKSNALPLSTIMPMGQD